MNVNGSAFKKAREEIRKNSEKPKGFRGEAGEGTQEWLAQTAKIRSANGEIKALSVRTIQYLEQGKASILTIDAVSPHLRINGRELIVGYGNDHISLDAPNVIDFRPTLYPRVGQGFQLSPFLLTIDPLIITFSENEDIDIAKLVGMTIKMKLGHLDMRLGWLYKVGLHPGGNNWLGIKDEIYPEVLHSPSTYRASIMFHQITEKTISWQEFVTTIEASNLRVLQLEVTIEFEYFIKEIKIGIILSEIGTFISKGRQKYSSEWPYFAQPKTIVWKE